MVRNREKKIVINEDLNCYLDFIDRDWLAEDLSRFADSSPYREPVETLFHTWGAISSANGIPLGILSRVQDVDKQEVWDKPCRLPHWYTEVAHDSRKRQGKVFGLCRELFLIAGAERICSSCKQWSNRSTMLKNSPLSLLKNLERRYAIAVGITQRFNFISKLASACHNQGANQAVGSQTLSMALKCKTAFFISELKT